MSCKSCGSANRNTFPAEMSIHFSGLENLYRSPVLVLPKLLLCLDCGFAEFSVNDAELRQLAAPALPGGVYEAYARAE